MMQMMAWCPQAMDEKLDAADCEVFGESDALGWWPSPYNTWSGLEGMADYTLHDLGGDWCQADFACGNIDPSAWKPWLGHVRGFPARRVGGHRTVPRMTNFKEKTHKAKEQVAITTIMIRNLPNKYSSQMLVEELNSLGLNNLFDFVYVPMDQLTRWNVGYGFVNFINAKAAKDCTQVLTGYKFHRCNPRQQRDIQVVPAHMQGLWKNLEHYRRTAVQFNRDSRRRPMIILEALGHLTDAERVDLHHEFGHLIQTSQR
mmetsp:Transcript_12811/g.22084  ORF Transcript_12811/g.22084 Transcript_12811/m.22084 type:complete len:258 (+) Transcript_12811:3-776(+)